jgi:hypothetical protein
MATNAVHKFYDQYIAQETAQPVKSEGARLAATLPDSEAAGPKDTIAPSPEPVKAKVTRWASRKA